MGTKETIVPNFSVITIWQLVVCLNHQRGSAMLLHEKRTMSENFPSDRDSQLDVRIEFLVRDKWLES